MQFKLYILFAFSSCFPDHTYRDKEQSYDKKNRKDNICEKPQIGTPFIKKHGNDEQKNNHKQTYDCQGCTN